LERRFEGGRWEGTTWKPHNTHTHYYSRGEAIGEVQDFKYLGSMVLAFGDLEKELSRC